MINFAPDTFKLIPAVMILKSRNAFVLICSIAIDRSCGLVSGPVLGSRIVGLRVPVRMIELLIGQELSASENTRRRSIYGF